MPTRRPRTLPSGIMLITLPSGERRYRLQLGSRGKGNRRSKLFPLDRLTDAIALREEWRQRGLPVNGAPAPGDGAVASLDDALRHRVLDLEQRGKSRKTSAVPERIRSFLRKHWTECSTRPLHTVTIATLEEYRDRRLVACQPNTVIRELRELRATLKQARDGFVVPSRIFPPEDLTRVRMLTPDQYEKVFPHLREHYGAVFADLAELALLAVLRLADVRTLKRQYVRLNERLLLLPRTKGGPRAVRLSDQAVAVLTRAMAREPQHELIFANPRTGTPYTAGHLSRMWHRAANTCGLHDFTFHDLRHHLPTVSVNNGATIPVLMAMGGWKSAAMVQRYAHVMAPELDKFLSQVHPTQQPPRA